MQVLSKYSDHIEVFNAALLRCGENIIQAHDNSASAEIFRGAYPGMVRSYLRRHNWSFQTRVKRLVKKGMTGDHPRYAYIRPADMIILHSLNICGVAILNYKIRSDTIVTDYDSDEINCEYGFEAKVGDWAEDFAEAVVMHCEGLIKSGLHEDHAIANAKHEKADELILDALARDANSHGRPQHTPINTLAQAWRGGRSRLRNRGLKNA